MKKILQFLVILLLSGCYEKPHVDDKTGLMWENATQFNMSYIEAKNYCQQLSQGDFNNWRLASVKELKTLRNSDILKGTEKILALYWSSDVDEKSTAQVVSFGHKPYFKRGRLIPDERWASQVNLENHVRCVRNR